MRDTHPLQALAATARIANIPSVVGNICLGMALAAVMGDASDHGFAWWVAAALGVSGVCLYLAGNFLNDWADREWDAAHRPERALPRGLFSPAIYLFVAITCGVSGLSIAAIVNTRCVIVASMIVLCIVLYTWIHKRSAWSVVPMGLCRALLPVLGFSGYFRVADMLGTSSGNGIAVLSACATGLFCYIAGLSLHARYESMARPPLGVMRFARVLFPITAGAMFLAAWLLVSCPLVLCMIGLLPYIGWLAHCLGFFRKPLHAQVGKLLAGIPLVDGMVMLPLSLSLGGAGCVTALAIFCMVVPVLAFFAGLLLQRLALAT